ncbi:MAG: N-acetylmuramoyl-L-alanine amidase [Oscillospiraceae bacterium]|nr:N-acetylmuramoyl-L-alanine amidase [Oscillospiraceae bacterium]
MKAKAKSFFSNTIPVIVLVLCCIAFLMLSYLSYHHIDQIASTLAGNQPPRTVVIDAGHGGEDGGASGASGVLEKDINLAIAKNLEQLLSVSGYQVVMTRTEDAAIGDNTLGTIHSRKVSDMHQRLKILKNQEDCIFISIHQNFFTQSQYSGTQIFYSKNNAESKPLSEDIRAEVVELLQKDNKRETKPATKSIYLLWEAKVPAVLVECGFLSNPQEETKLNDPVYQKKIAFSIYSGFLDYCSGIRQPS